MTRPEAIRRGWEKRRVGIVARFWDRMDRSGGPDVCWPWMGSRQTKHGTRGAHGGYGYMHVRGRLRYAHRHALELTLGRPLAPGEEVIHRCDNPPCCNPAHLSAGTHADNMRDMAAKGRHVGTRGKKLPSRRSPDAPVRICTTAGCDHACPSLDYAHCRECIEKRFFGGSAA